MSIKNLDKINRHPALKNSMLEIQKNIRAGNFPPALEDMEDCMLYMEGLRPGQDPEGYGCLHNALEELRGLEEIEETAIRGCYNALLKLADSFLEDTKKPRQKPALPIKIIKYALFSFMAFIALYIIVGAIHATLGSGPASALVNFLLVVSIAAFALKEKRNKK